MGRSHIFYIIVITELCVSCIGSSFQSSRKEGCVSFTLFDKSFSTQIKEPNIVAEEPQTVALWFDDNKYLSVMSTLYTSGQPDPSLLWIHLLVFLIPKDEISQGSIELSNETAFMFYFWIKDEDNHRYCSSKRMNLIDIEDGELIFTESRERVSGTFSIIGLINDIDDSERVSISIVDGSFSVAVRDYPENRLSDPFLIDYFLGEYHDINILRTLERCLTYDSKKDYKDCYWLNGCDEFCDCKDCRCDRGEGTCKLE